MKIIKYLFPIVCSTLLAVACTPMDENYKQFIDDGPITYLSKLSPDEITIVGERNKALVIMPEMKDPRAKQVHVYWANKTQDTVQDLTVGGETRFTINNLNEGTYIFEFVLTDEDGNRSLVTPVTAEIYGEIYEAYLMNRAVTTQETDAQTGKPKLTFAEVRERAMLKTLIEWSDGGTTKYAELDTMTKTLVLTDFNAHSLRYRTAYRPGSTDVFYSPWSYVMMSPDADDIAYDRLARKFVFPDMSDDDRWLGYELVWTDRFTFESKSYTLTDREYECTISGYESPEFTYYALFRYDDRQYRTQSKRKTTADRAFLDRSAWSVAPETEIGTGRELANVSDGSWTAAAAAIAAKNKSPYLSQKLPWSNTATDGRNSSNAHIDGDPLSYLSMVKGPGTSFEEGGSAHNNGGVASNNADFGNEIYFVIDLGKEEEFDYFRIVYRVNGAAGGTLRPKKAILFGSNDPACITDPTKWTPITEKLTLPKSDTDSSISSPANPTADAEKEQNHTGNVDIPLSKYRYLKCRYTEWASSSNTMQITEFYLGGTVY